jgi:hypothetical protein
VAVVGFSARSQSDLSTWIGAEAKYTVNKKWSTGLEIQSRNDLRMGRMDGLFISPSANWKPMKHVELGLSYRLTSVPFSNNTTNRVVKNRLTLDLTFQKIEDFFVDKSRFSYSLRLRGTTESQQDERTENTLRLNAKVDYDLPNSKLELTGSTELFYRFQRDVMYTFTDVTATSGVNRLRLKLGASYPLTDRQKIELYAIEQFSYPDGNPEFVLGIGYIYDFSPKKKTNKK